jgi:hypothetical protein
MITGSASITIRGKVGGALSQMLSLEINGTKVTPDSSGNFTLPMTAKWGLNLITAELIDTANRTLTRAQSFHYSTKYIAAKPTSPSTMAVPQGAVARLYQKAIDDGNRATINDLATIMEKVINGTNLDAQIPTTLASGSYKIPPFGPTLTYKVSKNGKLTYSPIKVGLKSRTGGVRLTGSTSSMKLPVRLSGTFSASGTVTLTNLSIVADINMSKSSGGATVVTVPYIDVNYSSIKVSFGSSILSQLLSSIVNGVSSMFKNTITKSFEDAIKKQIPGPIKSFLAGFKFSSSFTLPSQLGSKKINIWSGLDQIAFDIYGGTLKLNAAAYATAGIPSGKLGSIVIGGTYNPLPTSSIAMALGLRYDTLNQVLYAAWYSGALIQDLSSLVWKAISGSSSSFPFTITGLTLKVDAMLPPILMPGTGASDFDIGIGDLHLVADLQLSGTGNSIKAEFYASARMGANITLSKSNTLELKLDNNFKEFEIELAKLTYQGSGFPSPGTVSQGLQDLVRKSMPTLVPSIVQTFPIPSIDLSSLGGSYGIPAGTKLTLTNASLTYANYYLILKGDLQ